MKKIFLLIILIINQTVSASGDITVLHNINGYSVKNGNTTQFQAMAFTNGIIIETGSNESILKMFPDGLKIDGKGNTVLPALHDSITNIQKYTQSRVIKLDLANTKSKSEVIAKVANYIRENPNEKIILGYGWDHNKWPEKKLPDNKDLDNLKSKKLIWLLNSDGRIGWGNSRASLTTHAFLVKKNPMEGIILMDAEKNHTGIYIDRAINLVQEKIPADNLNEISDITTTVFGDYLSYGITGINEPAINFNTYNLYRSFSKRDLLSVRINAGIFYGDDKFKWAAKYKPFHDSFQFLHIHDISFVINKKISVDKIYDVSKVPENNLRLIKKMIDMNIKSSWQPEIIINNSSDLINAKNTLLTIKKKGNTIRNKIIFNKEFPLNYKSLDGLHDITLAMTPDMTLKLLNSFDSTGQSGTEFLNNNNITIVSGSNFPSGELNPFPGLSKLVNGINNQGAKLSVSEALETYTFSPSYANRQENQIGTLEEDKWADFILINQDIFNIKPNQIKDTQVLETWVAGEKVYAKPAID